MSTAARAVPPGEKMAFEQSFEEGKRNHNLYKYLKNAMDNLNRLIVLNMFKHIIAIYCELSGMNPQEGLPEMFLWQLLNAPPICITSVR